MSRYTLYESNRSGRWIEDNAPLPGNIITITNPGAQAGTVGSPQSLQILATDSAPGQTLTYSATGLPAGLSIGTTTGLISGTPTTAQAATVTVTVTDSAGISASTSFPWTIAAGTGGNTITVTNPGSKTVKVGVAVSYQIVATDSASGQTLTYAATNLPSGLVVNSATGLITGTPDTASAYNTTISATDTTGATGSAQFTWTVTPASTGAKGVVGATVNPSTYNITDWAVAANQFDGYLGAPVRGIYPFPLAAVSQKIFLSEGQTLSSVPSNIKQLMSVNPKCRILLCAKPSRSPASLAAEQANVQTTIHTLLNAGVDFDFILWQECNRAGFATAAAYHTYWQDYAPVVKALGVPCCFDPSCGTDADQAGVFTFFPGDGTSGNPYPDKFYCDWYGNSWVAGRRLDSGPSGSIMGLSDSHGIPFGMGEWGDAAGASGNALSLSDWNGYTTYLLNLFQGRLTAGKKNADFVMFASTNPTSVQANAIFSSTDMKIPAVQQLYNALSSTA